MVDQPLPTYGVQDGIHRVLFPDHTHVEVHQPKRDRLGRLWAEVIARVGEDRVLNRARFDLLDLRTRERFCQGISAVDGEVDWQARLLFVVEHVASAMTPVSVADAEPLVPPTHEVEPFPVEALPIPLARLVQEAATALPCPPDFVGVLMLPLLGTALAPAECWK